MGKVRYVIIVVLLWCSVVKHEIWKPYLALQRTILGPEFASAGGEEEIPLPGLCFSEVMLVLGEYIWLISHKAIHIFTFMLVEFYFIFIVINLSLSLIFLVRIPFLK